MTDTNNAAPMSFAEFKSEGFLADYHKRYREETGKGVTLNDHAFYKILIEATQEDDIDNDTLVEIVQDAQGDDADNTDDTAAEKPLVSDSVRKALAVATKAIDKDALELGDRLAKSDLLQASIHAFVEIGETKKRIPAETAMYLASMMTKDELLGAPYPGVTKSDLDEKDPDKRKANLPLHLQASGNNAKPDVVKVGEPGWWQQVSSRGPDFQDAQQHLDALKLYGTSDAPGWVKALRGAKEVEESVKLWRGRRDDASKALKDAARLLIRMQYDIPELTKLEATFNTYVTDDGTMRMRRTTLPIVVKYKDTTQTWWPVYISIGHFNRVDLKKVATFPTAEQQFQNFTVERKPKTPEGSFDILIKKGTDFAETVYEMVSVWQDKARGDKLAAEVYSLLNSDEGAEVIDSIFELEGILHSITRKPGMAAKRLEYQKAKAASDKTAAAS